ncbi:Pentatricopeptide repeat-containing protein [Glycine soja]|nr:Pentatricopeptide repeat-containing protein [Glycine soja]
MAAMLLLLPPNTKQTKALLERCSNVKELMQIYGQLLKKGTIRNQLTSIYSNSNDPEAALLLYHQMLNNSVPDNSYTFPFLLKACSALSAFEATSNLHMVLFNQLPTRDIVSWNRMIDGTGMHKEALSLLQQMLVAGIKPDSITLSCSLSACAGLDMYVKCGEMEKALLVFSKLEKKCASAWTALIGGFAINGKGLTEEGKSLFESMSSVYNIKPSMEHYGCMVDLMGGAGLLKEAREFVESMPVKPNAAIWGALLNACQLHKYFELGKETGKIQIELDPDHSGRYIHLASIYAAAREWNQVTRVRSQIKHRGLLNYPGCSSITLNGVVHEFFAGAGSHPHIQEIYNMPNLLTNR